MHSIGILGHSRRIFDYPILFMHFHYYQSIGIGGILLAIISLLFSCCSSFHIYNLLLLLIPAATFYWMRCNIIDFVVYFLIFDQLLLSLHALGSVSRIGSSAQSILIETIYF